MATLSLKMRSSLERLAVTVSPQEGIVSLNLSLNTINLAIRVIKITQIDLPRASESGDAETKRQGDTQREDRQEIDATEEKRGIDAWIVDISTGRGIHQTYDPLSTH